MFDRQLSDQFEQLVAGRGLPEPEPTKPSRSPVPVVSGRSEAISLLAALQREARLVDLVCESLSEYSDQQVGAAAREVLEESGKVIRRMFDLQPIIDAPDGSEVSTPADYDAAQYRLTGSVSGDPPFRGALAHHGWRAAKCEVPKWNGTDQAKEIVAPVEIEIA